MNETPASGPRVLVVEDEYLIRLLLEDMLTDMGYRVVATARDIVEARALAENIETDFAVLDVNLDGKPIFPVADILSERGVPYMFVTGYGEHGLPESYRSRPILPKPFQPDGLKSMIVALLAGR